MLGKTLEIKRDPNFLNVEWKPIKMPAINEDDEALWPERYPLETLEKIREADEFAFAALYQQDPIPEGNAIFRDTYYYTEIPHEARVKGFKHVTVVDLAYTSKTVADFTVILEGIFYEDRLYVVDMQRLQRDISVVANILKQKQYETKSPIFTRTGGQEKAVVQLLRKEGVNLADLPTKGDKLSNAQPVATAWNRGVILVNKNAKWLGVLKEPKEGYTVA